MDSVALAGDTPRSTVSSTASGRTCWPHLPRAVASAAQLEITRPGFDVVTVQFIDAGADLDRTFAAYAFSEPTPYTAQIVGADGIVLASWPS